MKTIKHVIVKWPSNEVCVVGARTTKDLFLNVDYWDCPSRAKYLLLPSTVDYAINCTSNSDWIHGIFDREAEWLSWDELIEKIEKRGTRSDGWPKRTQANWNGKVKRLET